MTNDHSPRQGKPLYLPNKACRSVDGSGDPLSKTHPNHLIIEGLFYISTLYGSFGLFVLNIDFLAAALLGTSAVLAIITTPRALKWLSLPIIMFFTMLIFDYFGYPDGMPTLKQYMLWLLAFIICLVLHENPNFFIRGKIFLLFFILANFLFLMPNSQEPSRYGLREDPHLVMSNPSDLAYWCIFAVLASIAEVIRKKGFVRIAYIAVAIVSSIVLLLTVSRGGLLILVVCLLIFLTLNASKLGGFGAMFTLLVTIGIALLIIFFTQTEAISQYEQRFAEETGDFSGRTFLLDEAIRVFLENPWLGTGKDEVNPPLHSKALVPHNQYLGLAVHYGIWPPIFLIMFLLQLATKAISSLMAKQEPSSYNVSSELFVFLLFFLLMSMVSNVMLLSTFCIFYMAKILLYKPNYL
jgi:O-antigen ligase